MSLQLEVLIDTGIIYKQLKHGTDISQLLGTIGSLSLRVHAASLPVHRKASMYEPNQLVQLET